MKRTYNRTAVRNTLGKGIRLERKSVLFLKRHGFNCARSSRSLGPFDVIAISQVKTLLVQVKCNRMPSEEEQQKFRNFPVPPYTVKQIHVWKPGSRAPEVHVLAEAF